MRQHVGNGSAGGVAAHASQLGEDVAANLIARHHRQRWPRSLIAQELGMTDRAVAKLMMRHGVPALRKVTVARAPADHRHPSLGGKCPAAD